METTTSITSPARRRWPWFAGAILLAVIGVGWWFGKSKSQDAQAKRAPQAIAVTTAKAETRDVPVRSAPTATVTALQSVDLRAQVTSTVREVHIREGQNVRQGRPAVLARRARRRGQHQEGGGAGREGPRRPRHRRAQPRAPAGALPRRSSSRRRRSTGAEPGRHAERPARRRPARRSNRRAWRAATPRSARRFAGRTGTIGVRAGSLVQPGDHVARALVTVTQIDPIAVRLHAAREGARRAAAALRAGAVAVTAHAADGRRDLQGPRHLRRQRGRHRHRHDPREGRVRQSDSARSGRACT